MLTAEWICTSCGTTNRKLVAAGQTEVNDRCVSCHTKHHVTQQERPVRWLARQPQ